MEGECAASGTPHADNVAPSVMGGFVLVRSYDPFEIVQLPVPDGLRIAVVHPHCQVSTAEARRLVKDRTYGLDVIVPNIGSVAALVAALYRGDLPLLGRSIDDRIIEPLRATLIPGFAAVKQAALDAGALGCSIAGSGPSVFAFADEDAAAQRIGAEMQAAFRVGGRSRQRSVLGESEHRWCARGMRGQGSGPVCSCSRSPQRLASRTCSGSVHQWRARTGRCPTNSFGRVLSR